MIRLYNLLITLFICHFSFAQWEKTNGPFQTNIKSFARSTNYLFALGETDGVFRSTDNGINWTAANTGLPSQFLSFNSITADANNIFISTVAGVFRSTDEGDSWTAASNGLPTPMQVRGIFINNSVIYAGTAAGIFTSLDNGNNWDTASIGLPTNTIMYSFTESDSGILASGSNGVYLTTNSGASWLSKSTGLPLAGFVYYTATEGSTFFAGTSNGVYRSTDAGNTWVQKTAGIPFSFGMSVETMGNRVFTGTSQGIYMTLDNGETWTAVRGGGSVTQGTNSSEAILKIEGASILAGGSRGFHFSSDSGSTWGDRNNGLPYTKMIDMATNGEDVFLATEKGLYATEESSNEWSHRFNNYCSSVEANGESIFVGSNFGWIHFSENAGEDWTQSQGFFDNGQDVFGVADSTVFARYNASTAGIGYVSMDNGANFSLTNHPYSLFANRNESSLFALDSTVVGYANNTWSSVSPLILNDSIFSMAVNDQSFFLGIKGGVLIADSNDLSWTTLAFGSASAKVTGLAVQGQNIFACNSENKVFASRNNGQSWFSITDNFADTITPAAPFRIKITQMLATDSYLFLGGENGIWKRPLTPITGIDKPQNNLEFAVYPNPTDGRFTATANLKGRIVLRNALGEVIQTAVNTQSSSIELDLSPFAKGIYFVTFENEDARITKKVILE